MKALQVVHYPVFGGPHNQALRLAEPLSQRGWDLSVVLPDEPGNAAERLAADGVDVVRIPMARLRSVKDLKVQLRYAASLAGDVSRLRKEIRRQRADVVVVAGLVNAQAAIAARLEGVPVVWQILDTVPPMNFRRAFMPLVTRLADVIMTTGVQVAASHPGALGFKERLVVFFPPVDCERFKPRDFQRDGVRAEWRVTPDEIVLGAVANLSPPKGTEYLIEALALLRTRHPNVKLVLVGAEFSTHVEYSAFLRDRLEANGLTEGREVVFAGYKNDIERQMQGFDVFVLGSVPNSEGTPTSIMEAMACGLPVVATDVGGVSEIVANEITGFVTPPLDPIAQASAAIRLLSDQNLRERMARAARLRATSHLSLEVCVEAHLRAFETAVLRRPQASRSARKSDYPSAFPAVCSNDRPGKSLL